MGHPTDSLLTEQWHTIGPTAQSSILGCRNTRTRSQNGLNVDSDRTDDGVPPPGPGTSLVAWGLLCMAVVTFAPAVVLPEWRAYQASRIALQAEQARLDAMTELVARERRTVELIQTDPGVVTRIAMREYGARPRGQDIVSIPIAVEATRSDRPFVPEAVPPPALISRLTQHLPDLDYDAVFCDEGTRAIVIGLSLALMAVAVWLPTSKRHVT